MSSSTQPKTKEKSPPLVVSEAVLDFLVGNGPASDTLGRKAVEIYNAAQRRKECKEAWRQLASVACDLVYALLKSSEQISLQDGMINQAVESLLNRILYAIRTDHGSSTARSMSEAQVQPYMDQLYNVQAWLTLSQRIHVLEDRTRMEGTETSTLPYANTQTSGLSTRSSPSFPLLRPDPLTSSAIQHGSPYRDIIQGSAHGRDITSPRSGEHISEAPTFPLPHHVRRNSNNPFLPLIERAVFPRDISSGVAPFVPVANSLRTSHIGGSSSTISKVDNSITANCNNVTNINHFYGNIVVPALPAFGIHPGSAYSCDYPGHNAHGGNGAQSGYNGYGNGSWTGGGSNEISYGVRR